MKRIIGINCTVRPPISRATTDVAASTVIANCAVLASVRSSTSFTSCWIPPTCEPRANTYPIVTARKNRRAHGHVEAGAGGRRGDLARGEPCTVGRPPVDLGVGADHPPRERHRADDEHEPEPRRAGLETLCVEQPFGERCDEDAADRQSRRGDRQRHRAADVEPAGHHGGRRHQTGRRRTRTPKNA